MKWRPDEDYVAKPSLESSNEVPLHLIKGSNAEDSIKASHKATSKELQKWLSSKEPYAGAIIQSLLTNDLALDMDGNPKAKII